MSRQSQIVRWYLVRLAMVGLCLAWDWLLGGSHDGAVLAMAGFGNFPGCGPCCGVVKCANCNAGQTMEQVQVVLAGIANGTCSNCGTYNGTFILDRFGGSGSCCWTVFVPSGPYCDPGAGQSDLVSFAVNIGASNNVYVTLPSSGFLPSACVASYGQNWDKTISVPFDCATTLSTATSLTKHSYTGCDLTSSTCNVTAL